MSADLFSSRLAEIRARFAANLPGKIDALDGTLSQLSGSGEKVLSKLAIAHRSMHEICGNGPTIGFVETGRQARCVERILIEPLRARRGLTPGECEKLREGIRSLRDVARSEMQAAEMKT
jgi:hypothetical protein